MIITTDFDPMDISLMLGREVKPMYGGI